MNRLPLAKDGQTPKRRRAARRRKHVATQVVVKAEIIQRQVFVCLGWQVNPKCTRAITDPAHLLRQSFEGQNVTDIEVGLCRACHDAHHDGRLRFHWDGPRPNANARPGEPGYVRPYWHGRQQGYHPTATGYRRPDALRTPDGGVDDEAGHNQAAGDGSGVRIHPRVERPE